MVEKCSTGDGNWQFLNVDMSKLNKYQQYYLLALSLASQYFV